MKAGRVSIIVQIMFFCTLFMPTDVQAARGLLTESGQAAALSVDQAMAHNFFSDHNRFHAEIDEEAIDYALQDQEGRLAEDFDFPEGMGDSVKFWMRVYTKYSSLETVIYDRTHPELVYEVLSFKELREASPNEVRFQLMRKRKIEAEIQRIRKALIALHKNGKAKTDLEKSLRRKISSLKHRHEFRHYAQNLRAQTGQRDFIVQGLYKSQPFWTTMEGIFVDMGVPPELVVLSLVESSFNAKATSRAGAVGVWQFMEKTAKDFMLVDSKRRVDERRSPIKSTVAAARLLSQNKRIAGSWPYAVVAYNSGFTHVRRVPRKFRKVEHLERTFAPCKDRYRMGYASKNYYFEFLALLRAVRYQKLFYGDISRELNHRISFRRLDQRASMKDFAATEGFSLHDLVRLNPDVRMANTPLPTGFWIAVPVYADEHNVKGLTSKQWLLALNREAKTI